MFLSMRMITFDLQLEKFLKLLLENVLQRGRKEAETVGSYFVEIMMA